MKKNLIVLAAISALMFAACAQKENQPGGVEVTPEIVGEDCNEFISFAGDTYTYSFTASHQWLVSGQSAMGAALDFDYEVTCTPAAGDAGVNSIAITFPENLTGADIDVSITISLMVNGSTVGTPSKTINFTVGKVGLEYGGVSYKIVKLKDGNWWMAENLRYVPEGTTVSEDPTTTYPMWYPYRSDGKNITVLKDEESIKKLGYLYNPAFALGVDEITADNYNKLEGVKGICPEGWHIPTWEDYFGLCGVSNKRNGDTVTPTNTEAIFYDTANNGGSIVKADAEGFNYTFCGSIISSKYQLGITNADNCSVESYRGNNAMNYYLSSTGYKSTTAYQMFGLMSTFNPSTTYAKLSLSYFKLAGGAGVRCVKDHKDAPIEGGNEDSI